MNQSRDETLSQSKHVICTQMQADLHEEEEALYKDGSHAGSK